MIYQICRQDEKEKAGILKHSTATRCRELTEHIYLIIGGTRHLGHAQVSTTENIYAHIFTPSQNRVRSMLETLSDV